MHPELIAFKSLELQCVTGSGEQRMSMFIYGTNAIISVEVKQQRFWVGQGGGQKKKFGALRV